MSEGESITRWLRRLSEGDPKALDRLMPLVYGDLRILARKHLRSERQGHTLGTTALVNEAYIRLSKQHRFQTHDRAQFFAAAGHMMRRILVDYARARKRLKRGEGIDAIPLEEAQLMLTEEEADEVLALDLALDKLAVVSPRGSKVVEYRFFAGLTVEETAQILGLSTKSIQRDWIAARAWLRKEIVTGDQS